MSFTDRDMGFDAIMAGLARLDGSSIKAGLIPPTSQDVILRGAANEFGTDTMPARPFMRSAIDANPQRVTEILTEMVIKSDKGGALEGAAIEFEELIKKQIADSPAWAEELAPETIAEKGFDHPLIDTSEMHDSISSQVKAGS